MMKRLRKGVLILGYLPIGGGTEKTNLEMAQELSKLANKNDAIKFVEDRKGHDFRYAINDQKIKQIGYRASTSFSEGIVKTLSYYKN